MRPLLSALLAGSLLSLAPAAASAQAKPAPGGKVVVVKMVDDAYVPANVQVRKGDVVRFVQEGDRAHNVEFRTKGAPAGFDMGAARRGPYVKTRGEAYEVAIDARFPGAGTYKYVCTPHAGMDGTIQVVP